MSPVVLMRVAACSSVVMALVAGCGDRALPAPAAPAAGGAVVADTARDGAHPIVTVRGAPATWNLRADSLATPDGLVPRAVLLEGDAVWVADSAAGRVVRLGGATPVTLAAPDSGALRAPIALGWSGAELAVFDPVAAQVHRYATDGAWRAMSRAVGVSGGPNVRFYPTGAAQSRLFQFTFRETREPAPAFVRFPAEGRDDLLILPPGLWTPPIGTVLCREAAGARSFTSPYVGGTLWHPTADGALLAVDAAAYRLVVISATGDTLRELRRPVERLPLTEGEWREALLPAERWVAAHPAAQCTGRFVREAQKPALRAVTLDDRGRTWVERLTPTGPVWEVWLGDRLLADVPGPARVEGVPVDIRGGWFAAVVADATGRLRVMRWRITETPGA
ncbi:MAG TPA: hypothetical protein VFN90_08010 [Gemmatimonadales bacterium]|nr:hypothetical protein [Gemmatimonadales bacterium]